MQGIAVEAGVRGADHACKRSCWHAVCALRPPALSPHKHRKGEDSSCCVAVQEIEWQKELDAEMARRLGLRMPSRPRSERHGEDAGAAAAAAPPPRDP